MLKMLILRGLKDFAVDLINPKLVVLKCTFFCSLMGVVLIWPQFTIHQKALGLTEYHAGIISTVTSVIITFLPFLSGFVGDKLGNFKVMMVTTSMIAGIFAVLFTWVPSAVVDLVDVEPLISAVDNSSLSSTYKHSSPLPRKVVDPGHLTMTFWVYFTIRISYGLFQGVAYTLFEAAVMANMQNSNINYGYQRAWGTIGAMFSSYLGGVLVEQTGGYDMIFYLSAGIQLCTSLLMLGISIEFKAPATSLTKGIYKYLNAEVLFFFGAMLAAGMFIGYLETFMYRYLFELGATSTLIGLTVTIGAPCELFFTLVASYVVNLTGHASVISIGLLAYVVRFLGFSFLEDPWWVLPLEVLESVANGLLFTAAIMYCTVLFPMETIASFRGVFAAVYFGVGKLVGTAIGSEIRERLGYVITFRIWAAIALVCTVLYSVGYIVQRKLIFGKFATKKISPSEREVKKLLHAENGDAEPNPESVIVEVCLLQKESTDVTEKSKCIYPR